ncbi:Matrixin family [Synechococcus sp. PCC 7335]|uniref:matrixin family metalloprotease n=1 Tax=Synechococcus sp. (strain ATCC 29403 / PCC 7335) TaxID=91464 RepID=UPI00017ED678|nr:matrixin family metalloprotease [Synechococcus sp. PCC 7335]EDX82625.1 Matrixin family [Synechococcus sp. PCC 7335]
MEKSSIDTSLIADGTQSQLIQFRQSKGALPDIESTTHIYGSNSSVMCDTDARGHAKPKSSRRNLIEAVLDASEGVIRLWAPNTILRWKFQERSIALLEDPEAAKLAIKELLAQALLAWGDAAPVKFTQREDAWDFEIEVRESDKCRRTQNQEKACVLASAFFPDAGRHELVIYPKMFTQSREEQIDTLIHELGHIFGLRHFFANVRETAFASEIFGTHDSFSIMNYGDESRLTEADKADLKKLYQMVWSGELSEINGTRIELVKPSHAL